jgi:hypothetical protein
VSGDATSLAANVSAAAADIAPIRLVADPAVLRVWDNTTVRLRVEPADAPFSRYLWHFEDGSPPVAGPAVEHVFAESVRDRHVTVEAVHVDAARTGRAPLVVSLRLPVERLDVLPVERHAKAETGLGPATGPRLLCVGGSVVPAAVELVVDRAVALGAAAVVVTGDTTSAAAMAAECRERAPELAVLHAPAQPDPPAAAVSPPLHIAHDGGGKVAAVQRGERWTGLVAMGEVAFVPVDTRGETLDEPGLRALRDRLALASAYGSVVLVTARPLTLLRDGELVADRAYRIYEHALRQQVTAVVSSASGVFYDGRFGGVAIVAVGSLDPPACPRLLGVAGCQPASVSIVDLEPRNRVTVHVLTGERLDRPVDARWLPPEVGKVRR